jgi:hypothetical protein
MKIIKIQKAHWRKPCLVALCALALTSTPPREAAADLTEYALLSTLIGGIRLEVEADFGTSFVEMVDRLQSAAESARAANLQGDQATEIPNLSKVIGAANALMGMTSSCDVCVELRDDLRQVIEIASNLKLQAQAE